MDFLVVLKRTSCEKEIGDKINKYFIVVFLSFLRLMI